MRAEPELAREAFAALAAEERLGRALVLEPESPPAASLVTRSRRRIRQTLRQGYLTAMRRRREIESFLSGARAADPVKITISRAPIAPRQAWGGD